MSSFLKKCFVATLTALPLFSAEIWRVDEAEMNAYESIGSMVEFKMGYFIFGDSTMRKIYDKGGLDIQLSGSFLLKNWFKRYNLELYSSVEYFERSGRSIGGDQKTSIWALPFSLGLKPVFAMNSKTQYYFALGPRYFYLHQHNHSDYVSKNKGHDGLGVFVNTGFNFNPHRRVIIDLFGEYSFMQLRIHSSKENVYGKKRQVGGFTFGGGVGYHL